MNPTHLYMDYAQIETRMKEDYAAVARAYRRNDERDATGPDHRRIAGILGSLCCDFQRPIAVLDVGCGTGRYFHCLNNVENLVAMDVSEEMLREARDPVCGAEISVRHIELVCGNFYTKNFPSGSFDLIYCVGVFGNGCDLTPAVCDRFYDWLAPDGCVFFDAIDSSGSPWRLQLRKRVKSFIYGLLPRRIQNAWDERTGALPFFMTSQRHIEKMFKHTKFPHFMVKSKEYVLPLGVGRKLECLASKVPRVLHEPDSLQGK
jgi:SAM-dependent methyltransferase